MFSASRFLSLGVVCFLLFATSEYGTTDCPAIKGNVDLILSIGPWKSASGFAVITTDLQLLAGTLEVTPDPSTVRLQLSPPESLAVSESTLYGYLQTQTPLICSDNLLQVKVPEDIGQERLILLVNETFSWVISPLTGEKKKLKEPVGLPPSAAWASADSRQLYAVKGAAIYVGNYAQLQINLVSMHSLEYSDNFVEADGQPLGDATKEKWHVKKAFKWRGYFYVLTRETVYFFEDSVLTGKVALFKVPYEQFFTCEEPKEATKNGTGKETKEEEETNKGTVTRAHSAHPTSTVAQHVNVVAWVLGLLCLFCLFPGLVGALLYYFLVYSKKESLQGRVLSSGSVSFNGGLVHIHSKTGEPKVKVPRSPKASPTKVKMASSKGATPSQLPGGLRVPTKVNVDVAKKQAAKLALKRASTGALKVKRENSKVQGASDNKSK